jgi:hypothetical protein
MTLFHGSMYEQDELMPGYKRSGVLHSWDECESNEWLYATTNLDEAIRQGLYSLLAQQFDVKRVSSAGKQVVIEIYPDQKPPQLDAYERFKNNSQEFFNTFKIYLYSIDQRDKDEWVRNHNPHNHLTTEWKTQSVIKDAIRAVSVIEPMLWMGRREMTLEFVEPGKRPFFLRC